ncbi:MAG: 2-hydroxyacyl-CoA dehydratase family protein, partial [Chloroflexi bacterium]|nr:2-hydroxyacyl-CoA dehydratase family protein [Chloroflexota bacterium]
VFVCSWYLSIGADGYARNCLGDPLRALASRHLMLGLYAGPDWDIKEAKLHKVRGALMMGSDCPGGGVARKMTQMAYEAAGIPMFLIDPVWDEETVKAEVSHFIETRLA